MPYSLTTFDPVAANHILKINPSSVLDVGAGMGKYGKIIKSICPSTKLVGIEPTKSYIENYKLREFYDNIEEKTLQEYCLKNASDRHDLVIFGDVLEHFFRSEAIDYIDYFLYRSQWVMVVWPSRMPQDSWEGNNFEIHKSNFNIAELTAKFDVEYYQKSFGWFHWNDAEMTHCWYNYAVMRGYVVKRNASL